MTSQSPSHLALVSPWQSLYLADLLSIPPSSDILFSTPRTIPRQKYIKSKQTFREVIQTLIKETAYILWKSGYSEARVLRHQAHRDSREFHLLHSFWPQTILNIFHSLLFPISNMHFPAQLRKYQVVGLTCKQEAGIGLSSELLIAIPGSPGRFDCAKPCRYLHFGKWTLHHNPGNVICIWCQSHRWCFEMNITRTGYFCTWSGCSVGMRTVGKVWPRTKQTQIFVLPSVCHTSWEKLCYWACCISDWSKGGVASPTYLSESGLALRQFFSVEVLCGRSSPTPTPLGVESSSRSFFFVFFWQSSNEISSLTPGSEIS